MVNVRWFATWLRRADHLAVRPREAGGRWALLSGPQQPFEVFILGAAIAAGLVGLLRLRPLTAVEQGLPPFVITSWAVVLIISGVAGLAGCYWWWDPLTGLLLERAAMFFSAATGVGYCAALAGYVGGRSTGIMIYVSAYTLASLWQARIITTKLSGLSKLRR